MKMLRVDAAHQQVAWEPVPAEYERLGGRALIARILLKEVPATCDPLGPANKLILAPGLLGGTTTTSAGRLSAGGKSPLTGGAKEANAGGNAGGDLGRLGIRGVIVEGQAAPGELYVLHIARNGAELVPAPELRGLGTYATVDALKEHWGANCTVISVGPAGEQRLAAAGIAVTGEGRQNSRHAARGGLGALMGSKGLKAVVLQARGTPAVPLADPQLFRRAAKRFAQELIASPKTGKKGSSHLYGTASIVAPVNELGCFPTRNFREGSFEEAENLRGETNREMTLSRGGEMGTRCMPGCVIACSNVFVDPAGKPVVATLQYETIGLLGSNLGLGTLDEVAELNYLCNDLGLDTIEVGAALGVAAEAGLATFGDKDSFVALLAEIGRGTVLGRVLGQGAAVTGRVLGVNRVPAVKGQAMPAYDPRALKGNGVTYATSPMGADHTAGNAFGARNEVGPLAVQGHPALTRKLQLAAAMLDSTGLCLFARPPLLADPQLTVDLINGRYGWGWTVEDLDQFNRQVLRDELEFNRRAGFSAAHDRLPEFMTREPLPPHNAVFDVPQSDLEGALAGL
jgi:aldehyde:ferredoxin oxidoreductase